MSKVRHIKDPYYLARQKPLDVKEHQVRGLLPRIRSMIGMCYKMRLGAMTALEANLPYNFFVAENPDPRDSDYDVIFNPVITPVAEVDEDGIEVTTEIMVEEAAVNGKVYKVPRYKVVHMTWLYHNGTNFEQREGMFEGVVGYIAQAMTERLNGTYVGTTDEYEEVVIVQQ